MTDKNIDIEKMRSSILSDIHAGFAAGIGPLILDERRVRTADAEELLSIAKEYGYKV